MLVRDITANNYTTGTPRGFINRFALLALLCSSFIVLTAARALSEGDAKSRRIDCGVLAAEVVLKSFGVELRGQNDFENLCRQTPLSLATLEMLFQKYNLEVSSYRLINAPQAMIRRVNQRRCQAIVLCPSGLSLDTNLENPGHYNILLGVTPDTMEWLDPTTGLKSQLNIQHNPDLAKSFHVQFVDRQNAFSTSFVNLTTCWGLFAIAGITLLGCAVLYHRLSTSHGIHPEC